MSIIAASPVSVAESFEPMPPTTTSFPFEQITMVDTLQASPVLDTPTGNLVLRIRGSSRDGQVVNLESTKCTVGSGPRCTLRLDAIGVRPIHCMIIRGETRTIVRRWAPDTRLNGRAFTDADLVQGDAALAAAVDYVIGGLEYTDA